MAISPGTRGRWTGKLSAAALGLLFAAVLLELGLRLFGAGFLFLQERRNRVTLRHPGAFRILCEGDSMTAGTYPRHLEAILNARGQGRRFAVIDEGRQATTSRNTVATLPEHLAKYKPDMVVVMMGSNDPGEVLLYGGLPASGGSPLRIVRLAAYLRYLASRRRAGPQPAAPEAPPPSDDGPALGPPSAEEAAVAPLVAEGRALLFQGQTPAAVESFSRSLRLHPDSPELLMGLGDCYLLLGEDRRPRELFERAVRKASPRMLYAALNHLGWHYREHGDLERAAAVYERVIRLAPRQSAAYRELALATLLSGRPDDATPLFEKAALYGQGSGPHVQLGSHYLFLDRPADAARTFQRAAEADPNDPRAFGGLATSYGMLGRTKLAAQALAKANALRARRCVVMTRDNYRRIRQLVEAAGARLVAVQYPRRSVAELRILFADPAGVLFVDNEAPFERALRAEPLSDYFIDFFGGDFGHCTEKGYRLLAADIADVILRALPEAGPS
ncbi:MAG: tetratricopeptide repeat protein [Elusimicrobia bacterium]|nr:tetratricopeptide repeat protein [Elusimicrobiota bacterium]